MNAFLQAEGVSAGYGSLPVIQSVDLKLHPGKITGVIGPNGAGKTTLLRALSGLIPLRSGRVRLGAEEIQTLPPRERARRIAWVQQKESMPFAFSVREWVEMGRYCHTGPVRRLSPGDREAVENAIDACCLIELASRPLNTLSGGECQRAHIARALAQEATLLFLDEPLTHLDLRFQAEVYAILHRQARQRGRGVLCVVHDLAFAASFCDYLLPMKSGMPFQPEAPPDEILTEASLSRLFSVPIRKSTVRFQPDFTANNDPAMTSEDPS